ncbi:MAG: PKD domain-containing protein [Actinobacteria bacterium]|nr:MAG: PKD domain-containing protein [Actinomycetota bacterium]
MGLASSTARRLFVAAALLSLGLAAPAAASVKLGLPHLGVIPTGRHIASPGVHRAAVPKGYQATNGMTYHGGSVMRTNTVHAVYWDGSASDPFPANYENLVSGFVANVAHDSGGRSNVYSTDIQYYDHQGHIQYKSTFAGALVDKNPFPVVGNCVPHSPPLHPEITFDTCLTDQELGDELDSFIAAHPNLHRGLGDVYLLFLPPRVQTCDNVSGTDCFATDYCAYHDGFFESNSSVPITLFANLPFQNVSVCRSGVAPNDPNADPTIDALSHEHNETITDPLGDAWFDDNPPDPNGGGENGDLCRDYYGPPGHDFNQVIGGVHYFIQGEWSNLDGGCALSLAAHAPAASIRVSATRALTGNRITFDGSKSHDPDGNVVSYRWRFGDGRTASGKTVVHRYSRAGKRTATLTVTDNDALTDTVSVTITVNDRRPVAVINPPAHLVAGRAAKFNGKKSHDRDGRVVSYSWRFGDGGTATGAAPKHVYGRAGTYTVKLTVTDDSGRKATAKKTVTVARR